MGNRCPGRYVHVHYSIEEKGGNEAGNVAFYKAVVEKADMTSLKKIYWPVRSSVFR
jgi:hypothetical protein